MATKKQEKFWNQYSFILSTEVDFLSVYRQVSKIDYELSSKEIRCFAFKRT